ncbi:MAG: hypothetical protein ABUL60_07210 [Myxococcales bacterium]
MTCPSCGAAARPGGDFACLACGEAAQPFPRSRVHVELVLGESDDIVLTTGVLERLVGGDSSRVRKACEQAQVNLVAELSKPERERLFSLLANLGARFRESKTFVNPEASSLRFVLDRGLLVRGLVLGAVVLALLSFGLTLMSYLAAPVAAVVIWGQLERIPEAIEVPARAVDEQLGPAARGPWREASILRDSIRSEGALRALGGLVAALCGVIEQLRSGGLHLIRADFRSLDHDAHALLRRALRLAVGADRLELAGRQDAPLERKARLTAASREVHSALAELQRKLVVLHASLVQLSGLDASNEQLAALTSRVAELQITAETALELSGATRSELEA